MIPIRNAVPSRYPPMITWMLIAASCLMFLFQDSLSPDEFVEFLDQFALIPAHYTEVASGDTDQTAMDILPVFSMMFLHGGWLHLILNMWTLWLFGPTVEDRLGHGRYLVFYLACGLAASVAHVLFNPTSIVPALGASGAIAGILGCYMRLFPLARVVVVVAPRVPDRPACRQRGQVAHRRPSSGWRADPLQIAKAVREHKAKVTVIVPHYAMSGGTLIALADDEIVMCEHSVLGPIDPQLGHSPAASLIKVVKEKPVAKIDDRMLVMADVGRKEMAQVKQAASELLNRRLSPEQATTLAEKLASGTWTHDYPIWPSTAKSLGLPISTDMSDAVFQLFKLYPQPFRMQSGGGVEYRPVPRRSQPESRFG